MKSCVLLIALFAIVSGRTIQNDWPNVRHGETFNIDGEPRNTTPSRRISNGQEATPGQFPYQAFLSVEFGTTTTTNSNAGSILTANYILTAAKALYLNDEFTTGGAAIVGAHDRSTEEPSQQNIRFSPDGIVVHAQYTSTNHRNNIAVVRLESPITLNDRAQLVRLPARSDTRNFAGLMGTVSGFGRETADGSSQNMLRFTTNPIMPNIECTSIYDSSMVQPQDVCLSGEGGRGTCADDQGGPLTIQDNGSMQIGIVGAVDACGDGRPSVYTRVSFFLGFIEANSDYVVIP